MQNNLYQKSIESLKKGGISEVLLLDDNNLEQNYIKNTLNSIFLKDIVARFTVRNVKFLEKNFEYLQNELSNII